MDDELTVMLADWIRSDPNNLTGIKNIKEKIDYLTEVLFHEYRPTISGNHGQFRFRLKKWINSATSETQKRVMFLLLDHLFFVGKHEFDALYLTAYSRHVANWLMVSTDIPIRESNAEQLIRNNLQRTLFTAITDSFQLGDFLRINNVQGANRRFVWEQGLRNFNANLFMQDEMDEKDRIVLLEDFVGSGSQMRDAVIAACTLPGNRPVLLCPLMICPAGAILAKTLTVQFSNLSYIPVLELEEHQFIQEVSVINEPQIFEDIRKLAIDLHTLVVGTESWAQDYGPFGYGKTGALIVKFDNCPDNTLPLIHRNSNGPWHSLFFRISREVI